MKSAVEKATGRQIFSHLGHTIYEWEQTIDEVHVYINPPPGVNKNQLNIIIAAKKLTVGLKGNPPFIEGDLFSTCDVSCSVWMIEDKELHIQLQKMKKAEIWDCVILGHGNVDPFTHEEIQKKLLLERFQEENPGFDFSQAEFNGPGKDPRDFCGGVRYQ
eukprot:Platyproteum_vivax@DN189_c0_g1_i1.p1